MDPMVTSALISAGSSLLGGVMGGGTKRPRYEPYIKSLLGSQWKKGTSLSDAERMHASNMFAGRIADAKAGGIHPLAVLGMQPFGSPQATAFVPGSTSAGDAVANLGQDIGRAYHAYSSQGERQLAAASAALNLENQSLQNDLLRSQINRMNAPGTPPGASLSLGPMGDVLPSEGTYSSSNSGVEFLTTPMNRVFVGYDGKPVLMPNQEAAESMEGNWPVGMFQNLWHNTLPFYRDRIVKKWKSRDNYLWNN